MVQVLSTATAQNVSAPPATLDDSVVSVSQSAQQLCHLAPCRKDLNEPPTSVGGIFAFVQTHLSLLTLFISDTL